MNQGRPHRQRSLMFTEYHFHRRLNIVYHAYRTYALSNRVTAPRGGSAPRATPLPTQGDTAYDATPH